MFLPIRQFRGRRGRLSKLVKECGDVVPTPKIYAAAFDRIGQIGRPIIVAIYQQDGNPLVVGALQLPQLTGCFHGVVRDDANHTITPLDLCPAVSLPCAVPWFLY